MKKSNIELQLVPAQELDALLQEIKILFTFSNSLYYKHLRKAYNNFQDARYTQLTEKTNDT